MKLASGKNNCVIDILNYSSELYLSQQIYHSLIHVFKFKTRSTKALVGIESINHLEIMYKITMSDLMADEKLASKSVDSESGVLERGVQR